MNLKKPNTLSVLNYFAANPEAAPKQAAADLKLPLLKIYNVRHTHMKKTHKKPRPAKRIIAEQVPANKVDDILNDRAKDYGTFIEGAEIMQMLKRIVHNYIEQRGTPLAFDQREAIDMIVHKLGRIINGNPDKQDHWLDVAGYATLVADRLEGNAR